MEDEILNYINDEREAEGLPRLKVNETLVNSARYRSAEIMEYNRGVSLPPNHIRPFGRGDWNTVLVVEFPLSFSKAGENLASVNMTNYSDFVPLDWVEAWMGSSSHRANILKADYTHTGIGIKYEFYNGKHYLVATQHFAKLSKL